MQRQVCNAVARSKGFSLAPCARRLSTQANLTDAIRQRQPENQDNQLMAGETRLPRAAQLIHLKPLKRTAEFGIPSCDLQLRSYSIQPLDIFCDFALRAAYYLGLPAYGPVPLPRITERWTVPRSHFIFKKSQENFERKTLRRMIQIKDGNPETVQLWLAYLRKYQYYGVGMKANVWEFGGISEPRTETELQDEQLKAIWTHVGQTKELATSEEVVNFVDERKQEKLFDARR